MNDDTPLALGELYDFLIKFILIGDSASGKSCLLNSFLTDNFKDPSPHTIGVEFNSTLLKLPSSSSSTSRTLRLHLWDTAGQERFRAVTRNYYRDTAGIILVYDITRRASFENLSTWLADARALSSSSTKVIVVGNKSDLVQEREVSEIEANRWAKENNVLFVETSSLTGENVQQPFILLARSILLSIETGVLDPEQAGTGVSYGERALRRVSSWGSSSILRGSSLGKKRLFRSGKCC